MVFGKGMNGGAPGYDNRRSGQMMSPMGGPGARRANPSGNAYGQRFMQQYGQAPGQMREQFAAFRQQAPQAMPAAPRMPQAMPSMPQQMPYMGMLSGRMNPMMQGGFPGMGMDWRSMMRRFPMGFGR